MTTHPQLKQPSRGNSRFEDDSSFMRSYSTRFHTSSS
jgi:hypothetical protein